MAKKSSQLNNHRRTGLLDELRNNRLAMATIVGIVAIAVVLLSLQGRVWWCEAGDFVPWSWTVNSRHNSQHILDPYSFTHILHGILEFWLIGLLFHRFPLAWRFALALFIESAWEVVENSSAVIERYRAATISLDYLGDSIANSLADIACCAAGFLLAKRLGLLRSVVLFVATEIVLLLWIRDSLIVNIIMLLYPIEAIKRWQTGGM
ncbi:MAG: DUF2585 family protein [Pyrinomonadaceae bacterium]